MINHFAGNFRVDIEMTNYHFLKKHFTTLSFHSRELDLSDSKSYFDGFFSSTSLTCDKNSSRKEKSDKKGQK